MYQRRSDNIHNLQLWEGEVEVELVLPSLKTSGGVIEAKTLSRDLEAVGIRVSVLLMWNSSRAIPPWSNYTETLSKWMPRPSLAAFQLPILSFCFFHRRFFSNVTRRHWIFTHYATLPLAILVPRKQRWVYIQDLEWRFVRVKVFSYLLKKLILIIYRRSNLLAANSYLAKAMEVEGLGVVRTLPIWASPKFYAERVRQRDIHVLMMLRKGFTKRLDLYLHSIECLRLQRPGLRVVVVTTEEEIARIVGNKVTECYIRPSWDELMQLYRRSKVFLHLSEHEGFGLPPLEAMGCGCVPICRNSGGPQVYMLPKLEELLVPLCEPVSVLCQRVLSLLDDESRWECLSGAARTIFRNGLSYTTGRADILRVLFLSHSKKVS